MKKSWLFLADRFDALKPRERLAVFLALAAVLVGLFFFLVFNPGYARYQQAQTSLRQSGQEMAVVHASELALLQGASLDPDAEARALIGQLDGENARLRSSLANAQAQLASPAQMTGMLRDLIAAQKDLELVSLRSAPAENLLAPMSGADKTLPGRVAGGSGLYRHGIELSVRGDYQTLASYLRKVGEPALEDPAGADDAENRQVSAGYDDAESLHTQSGARMAKFLSVLLMGLMLGTTVQAEDFFDPTRPPADLLLPQAALTGKAGAAEGPLLLQSVLLAPQRQVAVISGQSLLVGQRIRGYQLRSLSSRQAELLGPQGRLTLWLLPSSHSDSLPSVAKEPPHQGDRK